MNPGEIAVSGGLWLAVPIALAAGLLRPGDAGPRGRADPCPPD